MPNIDATLRELDLQKIEQSALVSCGSIIQNRPVPLDG
jgi:hypothetical protein